jgi:peptidoglycan/LPS O-acetylase OafA/YrhL
VVVFHFASRLDLHGLFDHGYLAVDFFFALSGYVLESAYGPRFRSRELRLRSFCIQRGIRLMPLVVFGTLLAGFVDLFRRGDFEVAQHVVDICITGIVGMMLLPTLWRTTLEDTTYPLNGPVWSLSFELLANICHALLFRSRRNNFIIVVLMLGSLSLLVHTAWFTHGVHVGTHRETLFLGFARVAWSYFMGVLLMRFGHRVRSMNKWFYAAAISIAMACPALPGHLNGAFDLIFICVVVPVVVVGAANCTDAQERSVLSTWSGQMSYPLYLLHYPLVRAVAAVGRKWDGSLVLNLAISFVAVAVFSWSASIAYKTYDVPVRRWIGRLVAERQLSRSTAALRRTT